MHPKTQGDSPLKNMDPFIDTLERGRLHHCLDQNEKTPLIIPGKHHIAILVIRQHHERIHHQGRQFTEGTVRSTWPIMNKSINRTIN